MFGIGLFEILVIALAGLLFVGPKKLPDLARQFGRFFVQIRRMTSDVRSGIDHAIKQAEHDLLREEREKIEKIIASPQQDKADSNGQQDTALPTVQHEPASSSSDSKNPNWDGATRAADDEND